MTAITSGSFPDGHYTFRSVIGNCLLDMDDAWFYANGANAKIWDPQHELLLPRRGRRV